MTVITKKQLTLQGFENQCFLFWGFKGITKQALSPPPFNQALGRGKLNSRDISMNLMILHKAHDKKRVIKVIN